MNTIRETEVKITKLPRAPSNDPVSEVLQTLAMFSRELFRRLEGTPDEGDLIQNIRPHQEAFRRAIRCTAPDFVPYEKKKAGKKLPKAEFLQEEEGEDDGEEQTGDVSDSRPGECSSPSSRPTKKKKTVHMDQRIYIDEVLKRAQRCVLFTY